MRVIFVLDVCKINERAWNYEKNLPRWVYCMSILASIGNPNVRKYNTVYLAKEAYFRAAKRHIEHRRRQNLPEKPIMESPEIYFEWWLRG